MKQKKIIDELINAFLNKGPAPTTLLKLLEIIESPTQSLTTLITEISKDQVMTTHVLSTVNSSHYGLRTRISSIPQAVSLLGFDNISEIVMRYAARNMSQSTDGSYPVYPHDHWEHSIKTALISRYLARRHLPAQQRSCYTSALIHDIGKLAITSSIDEATGSKLYKLISVGVPANLAELKLLGFDHAYLGFRILCRMKLSSELLKPVLEHHSELPDKSYTPTYILAIANTLAKFEYPEEKDNLDLVLNHQFSITTEDIEDLESIYSELEIDLENSI